MCRATLPQHPVQGDDGEEDGEGDEEDKQADGHDERGLEPAQGPGNKTVPLVLIGVARRIQKLL